MVLRAVGAHRQWEANRFEIGRTSVTVVSFFRRRKRRKQHLREYSDVRNCRKQFDYGQANATPSLWAAAYAEAATHQLQLDYVLDQANGAG
jgi:hypothetical protein